MRYVTDKERLEPYYSALKMDNPIESRGIVNFEGPPGTLERHSLRTLFLWSLFLVFVAGIASCIILDEIFLLNHFYWMHLAVLLGLAFGVIRLVNTTYRRLGS